MINGFKLMGGGKAMILSSHTNKQKIYINVPSPSPLPVPHSKADQN